MKTLFMKSSDGALSVPREHLTGIQVPTPTAQPPLQPSVEVPPRVKTTPKPASQKANVDTKKRVRLKPESREQLLDRLRNPQLSLHEASILLRVSRATVRRYADSARLPCQRTPGGQRRFYLRDIEVFYRQLKKK